MNKNEIRDFAFQGEPKNTMSYADTRVKPGRALSGAVPPSSKRARDQAELEASMRMAEAEERARYASKVDLQLQTMGGSVVVLLAGLSQTIAQWNAHQGFWDCDNTGEKIALMHSELSEALEADRKQLISDHIPEFSGVEEELADCLIRILDFAGHHQLRFGEALIAKLRYNLTRPYKHNKQY